MAVREVAKSAIQGVEDCTWIGLFADSVPDETLDSGPLPARLYDGLLREDFRLAVCAASLHWLDSTTAIPRIATLLRPGGWFAAWWTIYGDPARPSVFRKSLDGVLRRHRPAGRLKGAREPLDRDAWIRELSAAGVFDEIRAEIIRWAAVMSAEQIARLYGTFAVVRELPEARRNALLRDIADVVHELGGHVVEHFVTPVYLAHKAA